MITLILFFTLSIAKEDVFECFGIQFCTIIFEYMNKTYTPKGLRRKGKQWSERREKLKRSLKLKNTGRHSINKERCSVQCLRPESFRHIHDKH